MSTHASRAVGAAGVAVLLAAAAGPALADVNAGATLVQKYECEGCHGAGLRGSGQFPALYGIEQHRSHDQIVDAILHPQAPMPDFGLTAAQASDIADYLTSLDGGASHAEPTITITPAHPSDLATVSVHFPGSPPSSVEAVASMSMGGSMMTTPKVALKRSPDGHTYTGQLSFDMGGVWTLHVKYGDQEIDRPISIDQ